MGKQEPLWKGFVTGSLGSMAGGAASHPLDLIKVRLQIQGEAAVTEGAMAKKLGPFGMGSHIVKTQGVPGLFKGLTASLLRQGVYSGTRFGAYDVIKNMMGATPEKPLPIYLKVPAAMMAGAIGACVGNPADLAMVRMQADGRAPPELRRNYKNVFDAIMRVSAEEGVPALWTGVQATVNRAVIVTVGQIAAYDQFKQLLLSTGSFSDTIGTHFTASFMAAFVSSAMSHPVDLAKTRLMNMKNNEYRGTLDCMMKTARGEGMLALYKGFSATYVRQCPYVVVTWVVREQIKKVMASKD